MRLQLKKQLYKRIALLLSVCALIVWSILGVGASLAWFNDVSPEINNIFHVADFDLEVSYRLTDGSWESIDGKTDVFDNKAVYEPGYLQIVYLKVENKGDRAFNFYTAVNVNGCNTATNVFGQPFLLQDYLKFGVLTADSENTMKNGIATREDAVGIADMPLHNYDTEIAVLQPKETKYIALVVHMPKEVGNAANYRGNTVPKVELGITVKADQIKQ